MTPPNRAQAIQIEERRRAALELRADGMLLHDIAETLHHDNGTPAGYTGERGDSRSARMKRAGSVGRDIAILEARARAASQDAAAAWAAMHEERLEILWQVVMDELAGEDRLAAVTPALRILARHAKLRGLDQASRLEVTGAGDPDVADAFRALIARGATP